MLISSEVRHRLNHSSANPEDSTVSIWKSQWETLKKQKPVTLRLGNVHSVEEWCLHWFAVYFLKWWFHPFKIDCEGAKLWIVKRGEGLLKMFAKRVNQLPSFKISCKPSPVFFSGSLNLPGRFISARCVVATSRPMNVCCWPLLMTRRWSSVPWRNDDSWPPTWDMPTGYVARTLLGFTPPKFNIAPETLPSQ